VNKGPDAAAGDDDAQEPVLVDQIVPLLEHLRVPLHLLHHLVFVDEAALFLLPSPGSSFLTRPLSWMLFLVRLLRVRGDDARAPPGEQEGPDGHAQDHDAEQGQQGTEPQDAVGGQRHGLDRRPTRILDGEVGGILDLRLAVLLCFFLFARFLDHTVDAAFVLFVDGLWLGGRRLLGWGRFAAGLGFACRGLLLYLDLRARNDEDIVTLGAAHFLAG